MSELRQDPVSGDWIILAPERAERPDQLAGKVAKKRVAAPKKTCPFEPENIVRSGNNWPPILSWPNDENWRVIVIPNKYPILKHSRGCSTVLPRGPHRVRTGAGIHELVVSRDHAKTMADSPPRETADVLAVIQERYKEMRRDKCSVYTATWFNWGGAAGASIYHPHYQMLTMPIIPPDIAHSLKGSKRYFREHGKCVHCAMLKFDVKEKKRIIDENGYAVALAPFISRMPFEVRIFPKKHGPHFEKTPKKEIIGFAEMLHSALRRIKKYLRDPDLNFFIHTAPLKDHRYNYYHWHVEILPKISIAAGFELSTGVDISVVDPVDAARILKGGS